MDLNALPVPEEDDQPFEEHIRDESTGILPLETSVETMRRERQERRSRLKREQPDEGLRRFSQPYKNDYTSPNKISRPFAKVKQVPQGWVDCPSSGQCIGHIIPSKVPLDETYNESVVPGKRYSSKQVINNQRRAGRELGLVVDLTNSSRYYSPSEWLKQGIKHVKIPCKGRDAVPDNESVNWFFYEVMQFLSRQKHSKKYVLVHCTHGHNRTGFMIIHFLMRTQLLHVTDAVNIFAQARPPGIYKQDYVEALFAFYHETPENLNCPQTPDWKRPSVLDLNGEAVRDDDDGDDTTPLEEHAENKVITNDDVLGDVIPHDQQEAMRQYCYQMLELTASGRGATQFPGSHPVSLNRDNLQLLRQRYYYATWKADGTRYMMLITTHGCYLIDRNFSFRRVQMRFPLKVTKQGSDNLALIDGEMIIDKIPDGGLKRRYLAYDLMAFNSYSVVKLPFSERWKLLEEEVIRPRNVEKKQFEIESRCGVMYRYDMEPFGVRRKDFWLLSTVTKLLKEFIPRLSHDADGLIFQMYAARDITGMSQGLLCRAGHRPAQYVLVDRICADIGHRLCAGGKAFLSTRVVPIQALYRNLLAKYVFVHTITTLCIHRHGNRYVSQGWDDPYVPRTHEGLLKWKYPEMNSVDFLFEVGSENRQFLFLFERGNKKLMDGARVVLKGEEDIHALSGKIIECSWEKDDGCWVCMRVRADKSTPNDINTYRKVMRSINDNITEEVLLNEIREIIGLPMYADRIVKAYHHQQHLHQHQRRR